MYQGLFAFVPCYAHVVYYVRSPPFEQIPLAGVDGSSRSIGS